MAITHIVAPGDNVVALAEAHGFMDSRRVWDHPDNAPLRDAGRTPTVLAEGDVVVIPDLRERRVSLPTGTNHTFILKSVPLRLRIKLCGALDGDPIAGAACELTADADTSGPADGEGIVERRVRSTLQQATLESEGLFTTLEVSALEPVETESGLLARLNNLGYYAGEPDDTLDPRRLQIALEEFQLDQGVPRTGEADPALRAMVREAHGC